MKQRCFHFVETERVKNDFNYCRLHGDSMLIKITAETQKLKSDLSAVSIFRSFITEQTL